jgi:hypothetical protein
MGLPMASPRRCTVLASPPSRGQLRERRSHRRQRVDLEAFFQPNPSRVDELWWGAHVHDLSAGGVGLITRRELAIGTALALELIDPVHDVSYKCCAIVVHARRLAGGVGWLTGCRLTQTLSDNDLWLLLP